MTGWVRLYRYLPIDGLERWLAAGWLPVAELGPVHGRWSVLGSWLCDCPPGEAVAECRAPATSLERAP